MILSRVINTIAPNCCVICNKEGTIACIDCWRDHVQVRTPACFWCNKLGEYGKTCPNCYAKTKLSGATIAYRMHEYAQELIYELKYEHNKASAVFLASQIHTFYVPKGIDVVSFVPSVGVSQRRRGYNQAQLLAQAVARKLELPCKPTLLRTKHIDQIGLNRSHRIKAVQGNFLCRGNVVDKSILLIDDVITTGSTVSECAKVLKNSGAKKVWAMAVAKK